MQDEQNIQRKQNKTESKASIQENNWEYITSQIAVIALNDWYLKSKCHFHDSPIEQQQAAETDNHHNRYGKVHKFSKGSPNSPKTEFDSLWLSGSNQVILRGI